MITTIKNKKLVIFDIECYINYFLVVVIDVASSKVFEFELRNNKIVKGNLKQLHKLRHEYIMVGHNIRKYDLPMLDFLFKNTANINNELLYEHSNTLISNKKETWYGEDTNHIDTAVLLFPPMQDKKNGKKIPPKSLKLIGCALKHPRLQDLPFKFDSKLTHDEMDIVKDYCHNDCAITFTLFKTDLVQNILQVRIGFIDDFKIWAISENDSTLCNKVIETWFEGGLPPKGNYEKTDEPLTSYADSFLVQETLALEDEVGGYAIKYLSEIPLSKMVHKPSEKRKEKDGAILQVGNISVTYGKGGVHSNDEREVFVSDDEYVYIDADISSQYPNTVRNYKIYPPHIANVIADKFEKTIDRRMLLKATGKGKSSESEVLKIVLNSFVGKYLSKYSKLYYPDGNVKVIANCQILITNLMYCLYKEGFELVSANTDGIICKVPRNKIDKYYEITKEWSGKWKFELEFSTIDKFFRRDVNNYIIILDNKKTKEKGYYVSAIDLKKGYNAPVIKKAIYANLIHNIPFDEFIRNHKDIYDFCIAQKIGNQFNVVYNGEQIQQSVRYYVSSKEGTLLKVHRDTGKPHALVKNKNIVLFNDYYLSDDYCIDYDYYLKEAEKNLKGLLTDSLSENYLLEEHEVE